jgi:hypothetical protein
MTDLRDALFLEDTAERLVWGARVQPLAQQRNTEVVERGDRTIYFWGEHKVLEGLVLRLQTMFWKDGLAYVRRLEQLEHWTIGDAKVIDDLQRIKRHLVKTFGPPVKEESGERGEYNAEWSLPGAKVTVYVFEQHCLKLHVTIKPIGSNQSSFSNWLKRLFGG